MTKAKKFDLSALDTIAACNKPFELQIKHPSSGAPTPIYITVLGKDGDIYRNRVRAMADEKLRMDALGKSAPVQTLDKLEQQNIDAAIAATVSWRNGDDAALDHKGERLEFNTDNARRVYTEILPIRDQVLEAIHNLENFMPA